jgi:hypothetical protein
MTKLRVPVLCFSYFTDNSNISPLFSRKDGHGYKVSSKYTKEISLNALQTSR